MSEKFIVRYDFRIYRYFYQPEVFSRYSIFHQQELFFLSVVEEKNTCEFCAMSPKLETFRCKSHEQLNSTATLLRTRMRKQAHTHTDIHMRIHMETQTHTSILV